MDDELTLKREFYSLFSLTSIIVLMVGEVSLFGECINFEGVKNMSTQTKPNQTKLNQKFQKEEEFYPNDQALNTMDLRNDQNTMTTSDTYIECSSLSLSFMHCLCHQNRSTDVVVCVCVRVCIAFKSQAPERRKIPSGL